MAKGKDDVPEIAAPLYALAPERFVAERDALARAQEGRAALAGAIRRLRKPDRLAHALDRLARERPRELAALLEAGERLRSGQRRALSGGGGEALRRADEELRGAARALRLEAAKVLGGPSRELLAALEIALRAGAIGDEGVREGLRRGVLDRAPVAAGFGGVGGLEVLDGGRGRAPPPPRRAPPTGGDPRAGDRTRAAPEERARAARERKERERAERARGQAEARLRRALARAEAVLAREGRAVAAAETRLGLSRARSDRAAVEVARLRERLAAAGATPTEDRRADDRDPEDGPAGRGGTPRHAR